MPRKLSTLHFLTRANLSGAPFSGFFLARALKSRGWETRALLGHGGALEEHLRDALIPYSRLKKLSQKSAASALEKASPQLVHINNVSPEGLCVAQAAFSKNIPVVWHIREDPESTRVQKLWKGIKETAAGVVCVSNQIKDVFAQDPEAPALHTVYNGLDKEFFFRKQGRTELLFERYGISHDQKLVGTVGHVKERKGTRTFVEAACRALKGRDDATFVVLGKIGNTKEDRAYKEKIDARLKAENLSERVLFLGEQSDMAELYKELDIVVLPSTWEGCSRVLLEAMACAKPVIASRAGGNAEVLGDAGLLVRKEDAADLSEKISLLLDFPEKAKALAEAGRARFEENFTIDKHVKKMVEVFEGVLG